MNITLHLKSIFLTIGRPTLIYESNLYLVPYPCSSPIRVSEAVNEVLRQKLLTARSDFISFYNCTMSCTILQSRLAWQSGYKA